MRDAIAQSGLSEPAYATDVLLRDPRTVARWLAGKTKIPPAVVSFLQRKSTHPLRGALAR